MHNQPSLFPFAVRPKLNLAEIEEIIKKHRIIVPCPARPTLIQMCEDGTFESVGKDPNGFPEPTRFGWLVYEDSFVRWVRELEGIEYDVAA